jgi:hypothetical protein
MRATAPAIELVVDAGRCPVCDGHVRPGDTIEDSTDREGECRRCGAWLFHTETGQSTHDRRWRRMSSRFAAA